MTTTIMMTAKKLLVELVSVFVVEKVEETRLRKMEKLKSR